MALIGLVAGLGMVIAAVVLGAPVGAPANHRQVPVITSGSGEPSAPVRVRAGSIEINAPVVPVGVDDRGEMAVPEDVGTIGWYRFGPGPGGAEGSSLLSGHVDDRVQGRGAFYSLRELGEGDVLEVDLADGTTLRYVARTVEQIGKDQLPVDRLFDRSGPPRLTLVTCGGAFDRATRGYRDNVVVTAEPLVG
jgi:hypothetical protein